MSQPAAFYVSIADLLDSVIIDLSRNAGVETAIMSNIKVVRYQMNPTANWGPLKAAVQGGK